jgi:hypothetical protein
MLISVISSRVRGDEAAHDEQREGRGPGTAPKSTDWRWPLSDLSRLELQTRIELDEHLIARLRS